MIAELKAVLTEWRTGGEPLFPLLWAWFEVCTGLVPTDDPAPAQVQPSRIVPGEGQRSQMTTGSTRL